MDELDEIVYVTIVAHNEEKTLPSSMNTIEAAMKYTDSTYPGTRLQSIICHNGCTDNTPEVAQYIARKSAYPIDVINSKKGMVIAQNKAVDYIKSKHDNPKIVFIDADCMPNEDVISIFLDQFRKHPNLMAVGAHPVPLSKKTRNPLKRLKHKVLNFRAYHPTSQISAKYLPEYHPYADSDKQPIGSEFEKHSKKYFHGRCFAIRSPEVWDVPDSAVGEDTYLDCTIHKKYGPGSIRVMYNANVFFNPIDSLKHYIKTYARIHKDKQMLMQMNPEFKKILQDSKTIMGKKYLQLDSLDRLAFHLYNTLEKATSSLFKKGIFANKSVDELWNYNQKAELK